ncbi:MAG TPA: ATP-binding protein [Thermodesulfovibrionales bacterium]|jgi:signal transduction histidine kinase|nr:ATP-binding protein [Thermodesulfovibrionales bacterium]
MFRLQSSIRQKITFGYYAIVAIIVGLSAFTFIQLRYLEKKVIFGETISEFFDTTLEVRRFEKNYFLYQDRTDYDENIRYLSKAERILEENTSGFGSIARPSQIIALREDLRKYREHMEQYASSPGEAFKENTLSKTALESKIRETGKYIVTVAEDISKAERRNLQAMLNNSQTILIASIVSLAILVVVIGHVLSRMVVKPLESLEESMRVIAEGRFERVSLDSHDREILSLSNAFNAMIRELEMRQRHLVQSEKLASLGTLLSGVAHELNNPLSNISSSCQILMEEIEDGDMEYKKELLTQIDGQTDRARNIVRSLLDFSREREFRKETLKLKELFEETIKFIKGQVPTNVEIRLDVPDGISIFADKQRIQQAFLNLIKNGLEAIAEEGRVLVTARKLVGLETMDFVNSVLLEECQHRMIEGSRDSSVYIKICDTGNGIPAEILPKIFDPFFTTKDVGKGSGLGLFIVHEIIEEHGGCIAVDSEVGIGTTFFIRLPVQTQASKKE